MHPALENLSKRMLLAITRVKRLGPEYHIKNAYRKIKESFIHFRAFFNIGTGGGGANAPHSSTLPPSHSVFDPIKLFLFWNSCQCNDKVGYYPWNLCEQIKFWKRILRNRVLITKIMSILGGAPYRWENYKFVYCLCFKVLVKGCCSTLT